MSVFSFAVFASSWFEHIKAWYLHKDDINMLFLTYEEMVKVGAAFIPPCA